MIQVKAVKQFRRNGVGLFFDYIGRTRGDHKVLDGQLKFRALKESEMYALDAVPDVLLNMNAAQVLIDSLWEVGIRPSEGAGSAGAFAAQGRHLEDMQKLVFDHVVAKRGENISV